MDQKYELVKLLSDFTRENREFLKRPAIVSMLYDLNLLPECVSAFKSMEMYYKMVTIVEHCKCLLKEENAEKNCEKMEMEKSE